MGRFGTNNTLVNLLNGSSSVCNLHLLWSLILVFLVFDSFVHTLEQSVV